jgi:hypothetical protein
MCNLLHCGWQRHPCSTGADRWAHAKPRRKGCKGRWGCWRFSSTSTSTVSLSTSTRGVFFLGGACIFLTRTQSAQADGTRTRFELEPPGGALPTVGLTRRREAAKGTAGGSVRCSVFGVRSGEPRTGVRGCAICCTAGGNGIHAAQLQTGGLTRSREERGVRGGGAVGLWAFFEYEYEYRFTEYEYEGSVFLGGLVFFSLVLSPPRRTVLVLDLNWNRRGGLCRLLGSREAAKPRKETQGAFESLRCGLDQPVVFEALVGVDGRTQVRATDASLRASFLQHCGRRRYSLCTPVYCCAGMA